MPMMQSPEVNKTMYNKNNLVAVLSGLIFLITIGTMAIISVSGNS